MVALNIAPRTTPQKKPNCKCGWPGEVKIGRHWYCKLCLDYGDDEDADMGLISRLRIRLLGIKLC
jgi:hypothetical protein